MHVACGYAVSRNERDRFRLPTRVAPSWYDSRSFFPPSNSERLEARRALGIDENDVVVLTVGTCAPVKNHAALIEALANLPKGDRPLYLHVGIEARDRPERRLAEERGVAENVRFLGPVRDLRPAFAAADIYAMPSLYEGFSVAVLEALATGLPVLISDVGGLADLRSIYPALTYAEPTVESLTESLSYLLALSSEQRRSQSAEQARITRATFGLDVGVERYLEIYRPSDSAD